MDGHVTETSYSDSHSWLWMTTGKLVLEKSAKMTWRSEWTPRWEKFSEKAFWASSSWNRIWEGVGSEDEDATKWKGFWDGVDLRLGAINTTNINRKRREREKQSEKSQAVQIYQNILNKEYVCMGMHEHVTSNKKTSWAQPNPILPVQNQFAHI